MTELAPGVHLLTGFPKYGINWYLVGDVLIDAGGKPDKRRILKQLRGRSVSAHALTHAHPDHPPPPPGRTRGLLPRARDPVPRARAGPRPRRGSGDHQATPARSL